MIRKRVLFQGSYVAGHRSRTDSPAQLEIAEPIARALGDSLIRRGLDLILTGADSLSHVVGTAATNACRELGADPRERIRTYPCGEGIDRTKCFGMVLEPLDRRYQEIRTFAVRESDAVVGLIGGKGTSDVIQKAVLARKLVFPVCVAGGAGKIEWERLRREGYRNHSQGDLDFLADRTLSGPEIAERITGQCTLLLSPEPRNFSRRVLIVHGHDASLKNELARCLSTLRLTPVILHEQADQGRTVFEKLKDEFADVGFGFVLLTPDDMGAAAGSNPVPRARQNVVFEHGWLVGSLGASRVCAIVKDSVELPSDLAGVVYRHIPPGRGLDAVMFEVVRELRSAGYDIDANLLIAGPV
jgi:hypothetical protein